MINTQTLDACVRERIYQVVWVENQPHKSGLRLLRSTLQILRGGLEAFENPEGFGIEMKKQKGELKGINKAPGN